ncbi:T9SS C-terminal target domain-containing protein [bacterium]|nr:MAG: T9SS C-terminal target domain-containing protein [bacterium]
MNRSILIAFLLTVILFTTSTFAGPNYTGYSGAPGRQNCASSCHGGTNGTVQVFGFPESYTPNTQYLISLRILGGSTINNFNASCRLGTGSTNAGIIAAGNRTATYNVTGETNGVHLSQTNRDTCNFLWTAPAAGTGEVRLYVAAHQGTNMSGANTDITLVAAESSLDTPPQCTDPVPADGAIDVALDATISWTGNDESWWYNVYFGTANPPPYITFIAETEYDPGDLLENTTYYWKINPGNGEGETEGELWSFTTIGAELPQCTNPHPADFEEGVFNHVILSWAGSEGADIYHVYFGPVNPPPFHVSSIDSGYIPVDLEYSTTYYWKVNPANSQTETEGVIWRFTTMAYVPAYELPGLPASTTLGKPYPNPFNAETTIPFTLSTSQHVTLSIYDITGREITKLSDGVLAAGQYNFKWNSNTTASGVYLIRLIAGNEIHTTKILALK